ncbi:hypothetical protein RsoM2USA_385 [Ralstonia phage RsoM2USA]|nr:hypothetical protein RsoM2USA_385 [Ralstonia phage RsoM2USA]
MQTFKQFLSEDSVTVLNQVRYDNRKGWGAVPYNADVNYFGLEFVMKAKKFLEVVAHLSREDATSVEAIKQHLIDGGTIGTPFLDVMLDDRDGPLDVPVVVGHEGRNRVYAIMELYGDDVEILVHVFPASGMRRREITSEMIENLMRGVYAERSKIYVRNPFIRMK